MTGDDIGLFLRFIVFGVCITVTYAVVYVLLRAQGVAPFWANGVAYALGILMQYIGHALWTFRRRVRDPKQAARFVIAVTLGLLISSLITSVVGPFLALPDIWTALTVMIAIPIVNFVVFRGWVFSAPLPRP